MRGESDSTSITYLSEAYAKNRDLVSSHQSLIAPQMKLTGLMLIWVIKMAHDNVSSDCITTTLFYPHDLHAVIVHEVLQTTTRALLLSSEMLLWQQCKTFLNTESKHREAESKPLSLNTENL